MTNKVGIGIEAQLDTSAVEQRINAFGQRVAQANKVQFTPVSVKGLEDIETARKKFDQLLKVHGELNRRVKSTGQGGKSPWEMDFGAMYPDPHSQARQMRKVMEYTFGAQFKEVSAPPVHAPRPNQGGSGGQGGGQGGGARPPGPAGQGPSWGGVGVNVAQSGLRALGPVGGVAAGSLGTGMSAGFGAGLMGLIGGIAALGVGKLIGSVTEKIGQAEDNNVAMDRLKRTLGDVNVSFNALKAAVHGGADSLKITYAEAGQLAMQFAKQGNVSSEQYKTLHEELGVGVGVSRSFGLDPSQGVGVMGQLRGVGATSNTQDSRRFALLIGETIGKSGAFAKADEVMDALAGYTTAQTRSVLGNANSSGYAGMFAGMVGSGIPGLDPSGAGAILGRVNAALAAGGAHGEGSQFLTARVGQRMGLDPLQTQVFREGGMFATKRNMFGEGSSYSRYMGAPMSLGSDADTTFFSARMAELKRDPSIAQNPLLMAQAMSNDTGLSMNQAMTLMGIAPKQMGELASKVDLSKLSGAGIGNLSKAQYGTAGDRQALAMQFLGRTGSDALSGDDRRSLTGAMGNDGQLKEVLTQIASRYDQEKTLGSDVRDSKALLDNIKVSLADKLVPLVNEMRHGIMYMAGGSGKLSSAEIMKRMIGADANERVGLINGEYKNKIDEKEDEWRTARTDGMRTGDTGLMAKADAIEKEIAALREEQAAKIKKENDARDAAIAALEESTKAQKDLAVLEREEAQRRKNQSDSGVVRGGRGLINNYGPGSSAASGASLGSIEAKLTAAEEAAGLPAGILRSVIKQETGGKTEDYLNDPEKYHYGLNAEGKRIAGHTGKVSTAFGPFGILESTAAQPGYGVSPLQGKGMDEQIRFASEYLAARIRSAGSVQGGLAGYGEGSKYSASVINRMGRTPLEGAAASSVESPRSTGTKLPEPAAAAYPAGFGGGGGGLSIGSAQIGLTLDLNGDARRLLEPPKAPIITNLTPPQGAFRSHQ